LGCLESARGKSGAQAKSSLTVAELCKAFYNRQIQEQRSYRTIADDRWRLNQFVKALGNLDSKQCTSADISRYLEAKPPGSNRRSHFKTLRKLWRWAVRLGHITADPMANVQTTDKWGINAEHLSIASYTRLLRVVAGREPRSQGLEPTTKYQFLLPYFVFGGTAGLRTCELVRSEPTDPVLSWEDILWAKNLIMVRHEFAKQTRSRDHKRDVPLEPEAAKILKPLTGKGPIIACCDNHLYIKRRELARDMKIKLPENSLRNSYATYSLTFRSIGEVAKAMGDAESTVKRFYVQTLEPGVGTTDSSQNSDTWLEDLCRRWEFSGFFASGRSKFCAQNLPKQQSSKAGEGIAETEDSGIGRARKFDGVNKACCSLLLLLLVFLVGRARLASFCLTVDLHFRRGPSAAHAA
jgi:hypothetical protein